MGCFDAFDQLLRPKYIFTEVDLFNKIDYYSKTLPRADEQVIFAKNEYARWKRIIDTRDDHYSETSILGYDPYLHHLIITEIVRLDIMYNNRMFFENMSDFFKKFICI